MHFEKPRTISDFVLKLHLPVKPAAEQLSIRLDLNCSGATRIAEALLSQILRLQSTLQDSLDLIAYVNGG